MTKHVYKSADGKPIKVGSTVYLYGEKKIVQKINTGESGILDFKNGRWNYSSCVYFDKNQSIKNIELL